jgi:cytochrome c5
MNNDGRVEFKYPHDTVTCAPEEGQESFDRSVQKCHTAKGTGTPRPGRYEM